MKKLAVILVLPMAAAIAAAAQAQPPGGPGRGPMPLPPWMEALDANRDGELSAEELEGAAAALKKLDRNQDGKLGRDELRPAGFGPGGFGPGGPGGAPPGGQRPGGPGDPGMGALTFDSSTLPKDDAEKKAVAALTEMARQRSPGGPNVPWQDGRILRLLAESIGAKHVVEIGTSTGHSAVWFCLALRPVGGKLTTYEIDPGRAREARANFEKAGVADLVTLVEGDAHEEVKKLTDPIDLVFLDADKEGYLDYLEKLLPLVRPGGLIVAHNMNARQADPRYVKAITTDPNLETVFLNMERSGIGVTMKKR